MVDQKDNHFQAFIACSDKYGHINADMIKDNCFAPGDDIANIVCGPKKFINVSSEALIALGHKESSILKFF